MRITRPARFQFTTMDGEETGRTSLTRRGLLTTGGAAIGSAVSLRTMGTAAAQAERPDFGGWLDGIDGGFRDARGESSVTVQVGADGNNGSFAFSPAGLWVDPGTTVTWEWTGDGGQHNVNAQSGAAFESDLVGEAGFTFEYTFEEPGISTYQCDPHASLGMRGAVAVGDDVPLAGGGESSGTGLPLPGEPVGAVMFIAMIAAVGLAVAAVFTGEFKAAVRSRTGDGPQSAYTASAAAVILGLIILLLILFRLLTLA